MSLTFKDLQDEVSRRATLNQSGTNFNTAINNLINTSLFRLSREALWRPLRRKGTFDTVKTYTTGSGNGTFTDGSDTITVTGATFITDNIEVGRRIELEGSSTTFTIAEVNSETQITLDRNYDGGSNISGTGTYSILGQQEYTLPIQSSHRVFLWHEEEGYPLMMTYLTEQDFINRFGDNTTEGTPIYYRMWGEDMVSRQVNEPSTITISSSATADTSINIRIFGKVSGFPDFEQITTNASDGTTSVTGLKTFDSVERVVKESSTTGRITVTANSGNVTVATLPVGDTTAGILYKKVRLFPLPDTNFPVNVFYYKDPFRLVNDGDIHELGQDFDEAIILLSTSKLKYEQNQNEGDRFHDLYRDELKSLKRVNADKIDWFPQLRSPQSGNLGGKVHPHLTFRQVGDQFGPMSFR